jgi:hypothetical protein
VVRDQGVRKGKGKGTYGDSGFARMTTHVNGGVWAIRRDNEGRAGFDWPREME